MSTLYADFNDYLQSENSIIVEKTKVWIMAFGLIAIEDFKPSDMLINMAKEAIENDINIENVERKIYADYKKLAQLKSDAPKEKADKICIHIVSLLSSRNFSLYANEYIYCHKNLFYGIVENAGQLRKNNAPLAEYTVNNKMLYFSSASVLKESLNDAFEIERKFIYKGLSSLEIINHLGHFINMLWGHAFFEKGNTICLAVFLIKYLQKLGFDSIDYTIWLDNGIYFKEALIAANYENISQGIYKNNEALMRFLYNLALNSNYALYINTSPSIIENIKPIITAREEQINKTVSQFSPPDPNLHRKMQSVVRLIEINKFVTTLGLSRALRVSESTVNRRLNALKAYGKIKRVGSDRMGYWEVVK